MRQPCRDCQGTGRCHVPANGRKVWLICARCHGTGELERPAGSRMHLGELIDHADVADPREWGGCG